MIGEITAYSIISAVLFFNLGLIFVGVLRKNTIFLVKSSTGVLELLFVLSIVRLLIPWDNPYAYLLESEKIIPFVKDSILGYKMNAWLDVGGMLVLVWILGSIIVGGYLFYDLYQEVKTVRNYRTVRNYKVQEIADQCFGGKVIVESTSDIDVPQVYGIKKAHGFMPHIELTEQETKNILQHEFCHVKGNDLLIKLFYNLLLIIFWWNPLMYRFRKELDNLLELRCDLRITKDMNEVEKVSYLSAILKIAKKSQQETKVKNNATSTLLNMKSNGILKQRFDIVLRHKSTIRLRIISSSIIVALFVLSYFMVIQPEYHPNDGTAEGKSGETNEATFILENKDELRVYKNGKYWRSITKKQLMEPPFNEMQIYGGK